jgi:uncharacterized protein HemY
MRVAAGVESNAQWLKQYPDSEIFTVARILHMPETESGVTSHDGEDKYSLVDGLLKRFPKNVELLAYKIDLSLKKGDIDELISLMANLPAEADEDSRFWRAKGWLHLNRNELTKAWRALERSIELDPMDWHARNWMSDMLRREGKLKDAERLHEIVQLARQLRKRITLNGPGQDVPKQVLADLAEFAIRCDDLQVANALMRRIGIKSTLPESD